MEKIYEMEVVRTTTVRVRVPVDDPEIVYPGEDPEEVAAEFGEGGKALWPDYVLSEETDVEVDFIREVSASREAK